MEQERSKPPGEEDEEEDDGFEVLTPLAKKPRDDNDDKDGTGGDGAASMFKVPTVLALEVLQRKVPYFGFSGFCQLCSSAQHEEWLSVDLHC